MKATIYFIVHVENSYNNHVELNDSQTMAVNNSIESVEHINRVGKVVSSPKGALVKEGDLVLFHHNICRKSWGLKGKRKPSEYSITENEYYVPTEEIFMYMSEGDSDWKAIDPFVFVRPIESEPKVLDNGLRVIEEEYKGMVPLVGIMAYPNRELLDKGVKAGDKVAFQQDSEHEYMIKGVLHYKMRTNDILAVI
ncbi:chaperonin Cpn10 [Cellulophaga phage Calle_1]|uniref:Chaperonin Cpn10 n=1 Tax=Cellulophaga phage Calle_1 TaxID=2745643 RepID=A0A8E4ZKU3_9CAUD|nr:co-chaperonin GroES [Cellulophaga phage Calle_1]QQV89717.1 chaperonin Cpn10 [Cellulophaga phage Calle_1]QQV89787.1 chaperonin Cpn10 [Cellulophaga phage Calle_2]QQV89932.1 chaperonin Cpn10 [Cellulophaga phage Calle_3]